MSTSSCTSEASRKSSTFFRSTGSSSIRRTSCWTSPKTPVVQHVTLASPTQAQQPLRACSDTTSKRRQSPQASSYPRDVGRLGAEPPYDGGATTACEASQLYGTLSLAASLRLAITSGEKHTPSGGHRTICKKKGPCQALSHRKSRCLRHPLPQTAPNPSQVGHPSPPLRHAHIPQTQPALISETQFLQSASSNHPDSPQLTSALLNRRPRQLQAGQATSRDRASSAY